MAGAPDGSESFRGFDAQPKVLIRQSDLQGIHSGGSRARRKMRPWHAP